jgi:hypothetical protein
MTFAGDSDASQAVTNEIRTALNDIVARYGGLLGNFLLVSEIAEINDDDEADVCTFHVIARGQKQWHTMGFANFALAIESANVE